MDSHVNQLIQEIQKQTRQPLTGEEVFLFAYNNPKAFRGTGYHLLGNEDQLVRLLAGIIDTLSQEGKDELMSYVVVDSPETVIASALAYIDEKEKEK